MAPDMEKARPSGPGNSMLGLKPIQVPELPASEFSQAAQPANRVMPMIEIAKTPTPKHECLQSLVFGNS